MMLGCCVAQVQGKDYSMLQNTVAAAKDITGRMPQDLVAIR